MIGQRLSGSLESVANEAGASGTLNKLQLTQNHDRFLCYDGGSGPGTGQGYLIVMGGLTYTNLLSVR